ncbi:MAG TPA: DNA repair protein RadC, partial [Methylomirabilota bacterium]|jgi:DNA repair protein RadC|nr:DNA repair protein RadC [Methylomirabilota bacterium]
MSIERPTIREWPAEDRPRERFLTKGAEALSDAECLALLFGSGVPGQTAVDQAQTLLATFGSLGELASRDVQELAWVGALGIAKAVRVGAAVELARRLRARPNGGRIRLSTPEEVAGYFGPGLESKKKEIFRVALLDSQNGLLRDVQVSEGSLSAAIVHPREVFRTAILEAAAHLILVHNHPSGDPTPSKEDIHLTRQLVEGGRLLGLTVHDHVIVGQGRHVSFAQRGLM